MVRGSVLLTGASGQVGGELLRMLEGGCDLHAPTREEMDLADTSSVRDAMRRIRPRWIVNAGAYTAVDKAEQEPDLAHAINRDAVRVLGEEAARTGAVVIHFSTDYVFDGCVAQPYTEEDATAPGSVYGASKLGGEDALRKSGAEHLVFRTSWVYGASGKNFLKTIIKLARERELLKIVNDQHGAPTWSRDLAAMTIAVMRHCEQLRPEGELADAVKPLSGVYHAAGGGETTWLDFARNAIQAMRLRQPGARWAQIEGITTAEYAAAAKRPMNSLLDCGKLQRTFGWNMMDWQMSLSQVLAEL